MNVVGCVQIFRAQILVETITVDLPAALVIGRKEDAHIQLQDDAVSRQHARLLLAAESFILEDTSVNGTRITPSDVVRGAQVELPYGASFAVGPFHLVVTRKERAAKLASTSSQRSRPPRQPLALKPAVALEAPGAAHRAPTARKALYAEMSPLRRKIHGDLLKNLDMAKIDPTKIDDPALRPRVVTAIRRLVEEHVGSIPAGVSPEELIGELVNEALGLGPLEPLLDDPNVTEVMVVDPLTIYIERNGRLELTDSCFTDDDRVRSIVERIITPLGRRLDESQPLVDARLKDGSRVNAIIRPLAIRGTCITIRKFPKKRLTLVDLIHFGSINQQMARFLHRSVAAKKNILISGGTGSGKTTLLNILSSAIPAAERIITIEDAAELQLRQPHVVTLETKPPNMEGKGAFTMRDLVKNALRMRPDRIIVGECRGGEALEVLQAMNTGHDGSLTTIHANGPAEALSRLETLSLMGGLDIPVRAIREQVARSIDLIVQQSRLADGTRRVTHISEVVRLDEDGEIELRPIFEFEQTGTGLGGAVEGEFHATGYLPSYLDEFLTRGLIPAGEPYF